MALEHYLPLERKSRIALSRLLELRTIDDGCAWDNNRLGVVRVGQQFTTVGAQSTVQHCTFLYGMYISKQYNIHLMLHKGLFEKLLRIF